MRYREIGNRIDEAQELLAPILNGTNVPDEVLQLVKHASSTLDDAQGAVREARRATLAAKKEVPSVLDVKKMSDIEITVIVDDATAQEPQARGKLAADASAEMAERIADGRWTLHSHDVTPMPVND
jgi:hypothetical protein